VPDRNARAELPCGTGPTLNVNGTSVRTRLSATLGDLVELREVPAVACTDPEDGSEGEGTEGEGTEGDSGDETTESEGAQNEGSGTDSAAIALSAGEVRLVASASPIASATRVSLTPTTPATSAAESAQLDIHEWSATTRRVSVGPHSADLVLVVRENTNPGWQAHIGDLTLEPVVLDGWQQGWVVPAGVAGDIVIEYLPDRLYRTALLAGLGLVLVVALFALIGRRRTGSHHVPVRAFRTEGRVVPFVIGAVGLILTAGLLGLIVVMTAVAVVAYRSLGGRIRRGRPGRAVELLAAPALLVLAGWLWLTSASPHRDAWPQGVGILSVAVLWLSASVIVPARARWHGRLRSPRSVATRQEPLDEPLAGALDHVPAQRG
jgi:arabinofuranan 3-O-arabinosyltransferase